MSGGGEKWSTNPLAGEISPDGEAVYFYCPKKRAKSSTEEKELPPILGARVSFSSVSAPSFHLEGKTGSTTATLPLGYWCSSKNKYLSVVIPYPGGKFLTKSNAFLKS